MPSPRRIVLASTSRYRRALLERLQIAFEWADPQADETALPGESASTTAMRLAAAKARSVVPRFPDALVIGSDQVADTPNCAGPNYGTPNFPVVTCNNGPNGDMFMNYMDYTDDAGMFMLTTQQVLRMRTTLDTARSGLL